MRYEKIHLKDCFPFLGEDGRDPVAELYLPYNLPSMDRQDQKRPCMVVCPGGGYGMCSDREAEPIALQYLQDGFNVFVLTYSVMTHHFPVQLREVAAVMELIHTHTGDWHCDTAHVAISGFSAGGHLAAHYSVAYDCPEVRAVFPNSHPATASVLCYPVITADPAYAHTGSFQLLLGKQELSPADIDAFSCDRLVTGHTPPAFLWHTAEDACVPVENSLLYAAALSRHHIPFELHVYPFGPHGLSTADEQTNNPQPANVAPCREWLAASRRWLKMMMFEIQTAQAEE